MQGCDDRGDRSRKRAEVREREREACNCRQTCERTVRTNNYALLASGSHSFDSNQQQVSPPQPGASPAMPDSSSTAPAAPEHVQPIAWSYLKDNLVPRLRKKVPLVRRRETSIRAWPRRDEHTRAARAETSIRAEPCRETSRGARLHDPGTAPKK